MRIIDSNIVIYATQDENYFLLTLLSDKDSFISEITKLEVLGFHAFTSISKRYTENLFDRLNIIPISSDIINQAVLLRQKQKMTIGDAIVAATTLVCGYELITNNVKDFEKLNIRVTNPML
jgi:toxin FitB